MLFKIHLLRCGFTQSQHTKTHDDLLAGHHSSNDSSHDAVVSNKCDESLGKFSVTADVHRDAAVEHRDCFTINKKKMV